MPISFPSSPSVNDTYTINGRVYVWTGSKWRRQRPAIASVSPSMSVSNDFSAGGSALHVDSTNSSVGIGTSSPNASESLTVGGDTSITGNLSVTGIITVPTQASTTNDTKVATTEFVQTAISDLVGGAPAALDTLNELAAAINDDSSYAASITTSLAGKSDTSHTHSYAEASHTHSYLPTSGGTVSGDVTASRYYSTSNGAGTNYRLGDDAWIGDINVADTTRISGVQNSANGYIRFGSNGNSLGCAGAGNLTYSGQMSVTGYIETESHLYITSDARLRRSDENYGTMKVDNYTRGGYYGINLNGHGNFMGSTGNSVTGVYNDINNEWYWYASRNGSWRGFHDGTERIKTESYGAHINYQLNTSGVTYNDATCGGAANRIAFRWASPYVKCSVDNVICAIAADFSDQRIKANIRDWSGGINAIRQLRPVEYTPRDVIGFGEVSGDVVEGFEPKSDVIGLIAQEVMEVLPSAVTGNPEGPELLSIAKDQIIAAIISAVKDIDDRVSILERN